MLQLSMASIALAREPAVVNHPTPWGTWSVTSSLPPEGFPRKSWVTTAWGTTRMPRLGLELKLK